MSGATSDPKPVEGRGAKSERMFNMEQPRFVCGTDEHTAL
jgi:hypothetical protein